MLESGLCGGIGGDLSSHLMTWSGPLSSKTMNDCDLQVNYL